MLPKEINVLILKDKILETRFVIDVVILLTESTRVILKKALFVLTTSVLEIKNG